MHSQRKGSILPASPSEADEVTSQWLRAVLAGSFPDATSESREGERIGGTYGIASRIYRYRWVDGITPQSVVIKLWDTNAKAGVGEVLFYQSFQDVGTRILLCFFSAYDEEMKKAVLVLEDLKDAAQGDVLEQLDSGRAEGVTRSLARLHATWLDNTKPTEPPWLPDETRWEPESDWFQSRRTLFLERFDGRLSGLARALLDQLEFAPKVVNERLAYAPSTLLHGDFHLDNFVFEKQKEPVMLDWSRPIKGPQVLNLASLLFGMISIQDFDSVFEIYLDEFNKIAETSLNKAVL